MAKKKSNILVVGLLTAVVATIGGVVASLLSNKKTRTKITKEIRKAEKKVVRSVKKKR